MSLVIGINFGTYVLLAADTRVTIGDPPIDRHDDESKIVQTELGLIVGAGLVQLLDPVKATFCSKAVQHSSDLLAIVEAERTRLRMLTWDATNDIRTTSWLYSYLTPDHPAGVRLGMITGSFEGLRLIPVGRAQPLVDGSVGDEFRDRLNAWLNEELRPLTAFATVNEHFLSHVALCGEAIRETSLVSEGVGPFMDVAVHSADQCQVVVRRLDTRLLEPPMGPPAA